MRVYNVTNGVPIKSWADTIDDSVKAQTIALSELPFVYRHIALMPDCHNGYSMPIGGVMATEDVIVPAAVGLDIGCLDKDTEYLTENGWKKINEYDDEKILQYDVDTHNAFFVKPLAYIKKPCSEFYHLKNSKGLDQMLSEEHKTLVFKGYGSKGNIPVDLNTIQIKKIGTKLDKGYYNIACAFKMQSKGLDYMSDNEIRLDVAVAADGHIRKTFPDRNIIEVHITKKRKIKRLKELLENCGIDYKECFSNVDSSVFIRFNVKKSINKDLSKYWSANYEQLKIVSQESLLWDGHKGYRSHFSSTDKQMADVIQFSFAATNIRAGISVNCVENPNWKDCYCVTPTKNNFINITNTIKKVPSVDGFKYCFTVPTGYFVARRNNKIFITGNCGMIATQLSTDHIHKEDLNNILRDIRELVPVGFKSHKCPKSHKVLDNIPISVQNINDTIIPKCTRQLGTLGGGNHFIEVQSGSDGHIWVMVHTGSRKLGYTIGKHFIEVARDICSRWYSSVPLKKGSSLGFFPHGTKLFWDYVSAMTFACDYAKANREIIISTIQQIVEKHIGSFSLKTIEVPHNYARLENHFNKNVMVHRKGATSARKNEIGIIPGSQGTKSYIVRGLGNPDSFNSCSHGAGRTMSRTKAKKELNLKDEVAKLDAQGIFHSIRNEDNLDEASGAYKDIQTVMKNQSDLVSIEVELSPLAVIKG